MGEKKERRETGERRSRESGANAAEKREKREKREKMRRGRRRVDDRKLSQKTRGGYWADGRKRNIKTKEKSREPRKRGGEKRTNQNEAISTLTEINPQERKVVYESTCTAPLLQEPGEWSLGCSQSGGIAMMPLQAFHASDHIIPVGGRFDLSEFSQGVNHV
jgi:hypothetical protein